MALGVFSFKLPSKRSLFNIFWHLLYRRAYIYIYIYTRLLILSKMKENKQHLGGVNLRKVKMWQTQKEWFMHFIEKKYMNSQKYQK